jgi:hypothetical protein
MYMFNIIRIINMYNQEEKYEQADPKFDKTFWEKLISNFPLILYGSHRAIKYGYTTVCVCALLLHVEHYNMFRPIWAITVTIRHSPMILKPNGSVVGASF